MNSVKVAVLRTAGCNCDAETVYAFEISGASADLIHINQFVRREKNIAEYQILAIPGGFTYGDDISAGKILANELKYQLTEELRNFHQAGKIILGICNGFQVLVKAGLLPEVCLTQCQPRVTLTFNDSGRFEDRWIYLKTNAASKCIFTQHLPAVIQLPVAHAEGKFLTQDASVLSRLEQQQQIVFQYCDANGGDVSYPGNPNGSVAGIAGICDPSGRIFGLMPHPERYILPTQHPQWTRIGLSRFPQGLLIFQNAVNYFQQSWG
jgi:phosphoribosylformylglycinamidine synthase